MSFLELTFTFGEDSQDTLSVTPSKTSSDRTTYQYDIRYAVDDENDSSLIEVQMKHHERLLGSSLRVVHSSLSDGELHFTIELKRKPKACAWAAFLTELPGKPISLQEMKLTYDGDTRSEWLDMHRRRKDRSGERFVLNYATFTVPSAEQLKAQLPLLEEAFGGHTLISTSSFFPSSAAFDLRMSVDPVPFQWAAALERLYAALPAMELQAA